MLTSLLTSLTLLALAGATPVPQTAQQLSRAKAYQLQIQLLDPTKDLEPSIAGTYIGTIHVGAGLNVAVAGGRNVSGDTPFYTNGTAAEGYVDVLNDLGTAYPWGIKVQDQNSSDATYPGEHDVEIDVGGGSNGLGLVTDGGEVTLGGLAAGNYAVCNRFNGYVRANLTMVKYVYEGETLPDGCVGIEFVPLCAELNTLPEGSEWTHDFVQEVDCVVPA
ncbi:uncharacterized protein F4807DRAFT_403766 [Annulohypoxylon truncatum]|uniref:uncharacterized protein n=1 Tax=Annulohypoxylon truncatum TaxID=327061 RepID=UPI0020076974|nr:uncharacterized protein F4807DRAFT_403766 [Annulohypoxylon truncatum]KAI1214564.1 hypothetical protein F4807DRAFT_403766 [Annulohypoxylon truncatum]